MQTQTFNISLPKEMVKRADKQARKEFKNRSDLIRELLQKYLEKKEKWEEIFRAGEAAMKRMGIKNEEEINDIVYEYRHGRKPAKNRS